MFIPVHTCTVTLKLPVWEPVLLKQTLVPREMGTKQACLLTVVKRVAT